MKLYLIGKKLFKESENIDISSPKKGAAPSKQVPLFCKIDENIDHDGPLILGVAHSAAITAAILLCMDL